ncbi:hypothetical protein [Oceanicoccus sp. KOV_DT_Chl]|uniref:hypothetical protein n=1 Tax=Oceanicoccus sp. KOV_DT_Chl TaxID=1904639 RepID=UPI000C79F928|nr:hypothetical protein [Oceanicoccus sp. KOV_DT_Chl]
MSNTEVYNHYIPAQISESILDIMLTEPKTDKLLWQVTANKIVEDSDLGAEKVSDVLADLIPAMLSKLPARN